MVRLMLVLAPIMCIMGGIALSTFLSGFLKNFQDEVGSTKKDSTLITTALETLEKDMALLDNVASSQSQLSGTEVGLLLGAVFASGVGPIAFPGTSVTELLAPAAAACKFSFVCCC